MSTRRKPPADDCEPLEDSATAGADDDPMALFRAEVADVTPLRGEDRATDDRPRPAPVPRQHERDEARVLEELAAAVPDPGEWETGEELVWLRPGVQTRVLHRLRRGRYSIQDSLDLHQMNVATARAALLSFLDHALDRGLGCVRIVHGKGLRSRNGPRLRPMTGHVLRRHPAVVAFAACRPAEGGTGATAVLLRQRRGAPRRRAT